YTITVEGHDSYLTFRDNWFGNYKSDMQKILEIQQWGTYPWEVFDSKFSNATNLKITAEDAPNLSEANSMNSTFAGTTVLSGDLSNWDTSNIIAMDSTFASSG